MAKRFSATVERWVNQTKEDLHEVFQLAVQYLLEDIEDRTPVKSGFLRGSIRASTTGFTPLVDERGVLGGIYKTGEWILTIQTSDIGDTIYANFIANYAKYVEDGSRGRPARKMVALSVQEWQSHVNRAVAAVRGT